MAGVPSVRGGGSVGRGALNLLPRGFIYRIFFFLVKPSSYSRTTYTDGRGDAGGENTKAEARGLTIRIGSGLRAGALKTYWLNATIERTNEPGSR